MADDDDPGGLFVLGALLVALVPVLLACGAAAASSWVHERDLRDLSALTRTTAEVVDVDQGGKGSRAEYEVRFRTASGRTVQTEVPVDGASSDARRVEVAYRPDAPDRVRTVRDWQPLYAQSGLVAVLLALSVPLAAAWAGVSGLARRQLRKRSRSSQNPG